MNFHFSSRGLSGVGIRALVGTGVMAGVIVGSEAAVMKAPSAPHLHRIELLWKDETS